MGFQLLPEREVKLVGRKGAICLAAMKVGTAAFCMTAAVQGYRSQDLNSSVLQYFGFLAAILATFVGGNSAEHFSKKGKTETGTGA